MGGRSQGEGGARRSAANPARRRSAGPLDAGFGAEGARPPRASKMRGLSGRRSRPRAAVELRRPLGRDRLRHELVEVALHHPVQLVQGQIYAVIGHPVLLEVVGPDLLRAVAAPDHSAPLRADRLPLLGELHLVEPGAQDAQRFFPVLELRLLVLNADHQAGRFVHDANGRVRRVDTLAARSRRGRSLDVEVLRLELDLDRVGLRHDRHRRGRGVDAALRLGLGNALHPVHATLVLQLRVRAVAVDLELDLVEAPFLRGRRVDHVDLPAFLLGPLVVHAEKIGGEKRGLFPAFRALDLDHHVLFIVRVFGQQQDLELLVEILHVLLRASLLGAKELLHLLILLVAQQIARGLHLRAGPAVAVVRLDDLAQRALLAGELGHLFVVSCDVGPRHIGFDLAIALRYRVQPVDHRYAAAPAASASPSRAALNAQIATSSMSSEGWRVVNFCVPSTGSSATFTTGFCRCRAMKRISSKPTPAITGMASTRLAISQKRFGWNSATMLKTTTLTTSTTSRKPVPQRGWSVLARRTDGTSRLQPDSKALIVLCSAPWYMKTRRTSGRSEIAER